MRTFRQIALFVLTVTLCAIGTTAQTTSPYQFLRVNQSARAAALGGAFVQMAEDPSAMFFNPATISTISKSNTSFTFQKHVLDISSGLASYISKSENKGSWYAAVSYASFGSFERRDVKGVAIGNSFSGSNISIGGGYSNEIDRNFYYGVGLKYVQVSLDDAGSSALALDAGILYRIPESRVNIGFSILHVGAQLSKIGNQSEPLPVDVRLGINHQLRGLPLLVNFSFNRLAEEHESVLEHFKNFSIGGELHVGKVLELRLGYDNTIRNGTAFESQARMAGISFGAGLKIKESYFIDYAMSSMSSAALLHRFSLSLAL